MSQVSPAEQQTPLWRRPRTLVVAGAVVTATALGFTDLKITDKPASAGKVAQKQINGTSMELQRTAPHGVADIKVSGTSRAVETVLKHPDFAHKTINGILSLAGDHLATKKVAVQSAVEVRLGDCATSAVVVSPDPKIGLTVQTTDQISVRGGEIHKSLTFINKEDEVITCEVYAIGKSDYSHLNGEQNSPIYQVVDFSIPG